MGYQCLGSYSSSLNGMTCVAKGFALVGTAIGCGQGGGNFISSFLYGIGIICDVEVVVGAAFVTSRVSMILRAFTLGSASCSCCDDSLLGTLGDVSVAIIVPNIVANFLSAFNCSSSGVSNIADVYLLLSMAVKSFAAWMA